MSLNGITGLLIFNLPSSDQFFYYHFSNYSISVKDCEVQCQFVFFTSQSQDEDSQMMTEVDLFISTKAVKVLNADTQVSSSFCAVSI